MPGPAPGQEQTSEGEQMPKFCEHAGVDWPVPLSITMTSASYMVRFVNANVRVWKAWLLIPQEKQGRPVPGSGAALAVV